MGYTSYATISYGDETETLKVMDNFLLGLIMMNEGYKRDYDGRPKQIKRKTIDKYMKPLMWDIPDPATINKRFNPKFHYLATQFRQSNRADIYVMMEEFEEIMTTIKILRKGALHPAYVKFTYHHQF